MGWGPLKLFREEHVPQLVLHGMECCPYLQGDMLHKSPLLMEGLLQARIGGMRMLACHHGHNYH